MKACFNLFSQIGIMLEERETKKKEGRGEQGWEGEEQKDDSEMKTELKELFFFLMKG